MFIIWGFGRRTIKKYGSATIGNGTCSRCHNAVQYEMIKITTWFTLFFIPLIPYNCKYCLVCPICNCALELGKDEFMSMVNGGNSESVGNGNNTGGPNNSDEIKYAGKTETQIAYLKQMEEFQNQK